jgi:hypothetical protein
MTPSKSDIQFTKEWNDLGFYYDRDDEKASWLIVGSKSGILKFCKLLDDYSNDKRVEGVSEDRHFGPYSYLKFMTWSEPKIAEREICGRLGDFKTLSEIIKKKLKTSKEAFQIDKEYSNNNKYRIEFIVKDDNFEPASVDPQLKEST